MTGERTHVVEVPSEGAFTFRRRTPRLQVSIEADRDRILGGDTEAASESLRYFATVIAALTALTVEAPKDWSLDAIDPLDPGDMVRATVVYGRLRDAEATFRKAPAA